MIISLIGLLLDPCLVHIFCTKGMEAFLSTTISHFPSLTQYKFFWFCRITLSPIHEGTMSIAQGHLLHIICKRIAGIGSKSKESQQSREWWPHPESLLIDQVNNHIYYVSVVCLALTRHPSITTTCNLFLKLLTP